MLLPKWGGEYVLQALRQDLATARIPVIVLSSLPQSNADKLKEAGATTYIEKSKLDLTASGENLVRLVNASQGKALAVRGKSLIRIRARLQACRKCHVMNAPLGAGSWRQSFTTGC